jgi:hypothetical protein
MFRKMDLFSSSGKGKETRDVLSPQEGIISMTGLQDKERCLFHLKVETDPILEVCFLNFIIPDDRQNPETN